MTTTTSTSSKFNNSSSTKEAKNHLQDFIGEYNNAAHVRQKAISLHQQGTKCYYKPVRRKENGQYTNHYLLYSY